MNLDCKIAEKKVLTGETLKSIRSLAAPWKQSGKGGVKHAFVGIKQTVTEERKYFLVQRTTTNKSSCVLNQKTISKTSEQAKQRNTAIIALLSVVTLVF